MSQDNAQDYIQTVLNLYRRLQGTRSRTRRADRTLAAELHRRGVALDIVETALRLATARRQARPPDAEPLSPIRSLHYFLPVIDELPQGSPPDGYLDYLRHIVPDKVSVAKPVTLPKDRRPPRASDRATRQLRLPLDGGACPETDVSS